MKSLARFSALAVLCLVCSTEAAAPAFVQAISSAISPMTGFSMPFSTGLTGAKLAIGGKLLYYLGLFGGGGQSKPPAMPASQFGSKPGFPNQFPPGSGFSGTPQGMQANFMPPQAQMNAPKPPPDPMVLMQALNEQGINPLQLMQALGSAGIDPAQLLQSMSGGPGSRAGQTPASTFPQQTFKAPGMGAPSFPPMNVPGGMGGPSFPPMSVLGGMSGQSFQPPNSATGGRPFTPMGSAQGSSQIPSNIGGMPHDFSDSLPPSPEHDVRDESDAAGGSEDDVESFFTFLKDMDDNKCISRLICDIGSDPDFLGEFTRNIDNIINSLDEVPSGSGAQEYMRILELGRSQGGCAERFAECDDDAYEIVKSVAPSVGVPGMGADSENRL